MDELGARMYGGPAPQLVAAATVATPAAPAAPTVTASSHEDMALRMYGADKPPEAPAVDRAEQQAQAIDIAAKEASKDAPAPAVPGNIQELRDSDIARRMYSPQATFAESIPDTLYADSDALAPEVQKVVVAELREIAEDIGATPSDITELRGVASSITAEPSPEQRSGWHDEAVQMLNDEFGQDATQAVRDAAKFVQRDPRLVKILNDRGLGDHPKVILRFARLARKAKSAGKLR